MNQSVIFPSIIFSPQLKKTNYNSYIFERRKYYWLRVVDILCMFTLWANLRSMCRYKLLYTYILLLVYILVESIQLMSTICHFMLQKVFVQCLVMITETILSFSEGVQCRRFFIFYFFNKYVEKPEGEKRGRCHNPEISNYSKSLQPLLLQGELVLPGP